MHCRFNFEYYKLKVKRKIVTCCLQSMSLLLSQFYLPVPPAALGNVELLRLCVHVTCALHNDLCNSNMKWMIHIFNSTL